MTREHRFPNSSHVNLQEMTEIVEELKEHACRCTVPFRTANGTNSNVCLHASQKSGARRVFSMGSCGIILRPASWPTGSKPTSSSPRGTTLLTTRQDGCHYVRDKNRRGG